MEYYECTTYNSRHKVRANPQTSNMDAVKSHRFSQICVFTCVARSVQEVLFIILIQVVTIIVRLK